MTAYRVARWWARRHMVGRLEDLAARLRDTILDASTTPAQRRRMAQATRSQLFDAAFAPLREEREFLRRRAARWDVALPPETDRAAWISHPNIPADRYLTAAGVRRLQADILTARGQAYREPLLAVAGVGLVLWFVTVRLPQHLWRLAVAWLLFAVPILAWPTVSRRWRHAPPRPTRPGRRPAGPRVVALPTGPPRLPLGPAPEPTGARELRIAYDPAGDCLEVRLDDGAGDRRESSDPRVHEIVNAHGRPVGFVVLGVTALSGGTLEVRLVQHPQ